MTHDPSTRVPEPAGASQRPTQRPMPGPEPELPLLRFSLRHAFWFVTVLGTLLAGMVGAGGITSLVLLLGALVVVAHVTSTALGSRLQAHADEHRAWQAAHESPADVLVGPQAAALADPLSRAELPPSSPLDDRGSSRTWLPLTVLAGAIVGGLCGAILLEGPVEERTSTLGNAVGTVSLAVLGGWIAFLVGNFWSIVRHGWGHAAAELKKDEARRAGGR